MDMMEERFGFPISSQSCLLIIRAKESEASIAPGFYRNSKLVALQSGGPRKAVDRDRVQPRSAPHEGPLRRGR